MVDCRLCAYFKHRSGMSEDELEKAYHYIAIFRPGKRLLGWCYRYARPVTYYTGRCRGFRTRQAALRNLLEFLVRQGKHGEDEG